MNRDEIDLIRDRHVRRGRYGSKIKDSDFMIMWNEYLYDVEKLLAYIDELERNN